MERVDLDRRGVCFPVEPDYEKAVATATGRRDAAEIRKDGPLYFSCHEAGVEKKGLSSKYDSKLATAAEEGDIRRLVPGGVSGY